MPILKSIVTKGKKIVLHFDNNQSFNCSQDCYLAHPINKGQELLESEFQDFLEHYNYFITYDKALHLLSYREHSRYELMIKLKQRQLPIRSIEDSLNNLEDNNTLNDERFAKLYIGSFINSNKLHGTLYLKNKLRRKGIPQELIGKLFNEFEKVLFKVSLDRINLYLDKYYSNQDLFVFKKLHYSKLLNRGFLAKELNESLNNFFLF